MKNSLLLFFVFCTTTLLAQKSVQGIIKDTETNQPIEYAIIVGNISGKSTVTNSEGRFRLNLSAEDSKIIVKHLSYFTKELPVNATQSFNIQLQSTTESLEEIVILQTSIKSEIEKAIKTTQARFANNLKLNTFYRELLYINGDMYQYEDAEVDY